MCYLCRVGAEWHDIAWRTKQLFYLQKLEHLCSLSLQDTIPAHQPQFGYSFLEKPQRLIIFSPGLTQTLNFLE